MATDMATEAEKQLSWFNRMYERIYDLIRRMFNTLSRMLGRGARTLFNKGRDSYMEIGQREGDQTIFTKLGFEEMMRLGKQLNDNDIRHAMNFCIDDKVISPKDKGYRELNAMYRNALNAKTHLEITEDRIKQLNTREHNQTKIFKEQIKRLAVDPVTLDRITGLTLQEIGEYESYLNSRSENEETAGSYFGGIDHDIYDKAISTGYKNLLVTQEELENLKHDYDLSKKMDPLKKYVMFENKNKDERLAELKYDILNVYRNMETRLGELEVIRGSLGIPGFESSIYSKDYNDIISSPVYMALQNNLYNSYYYLNGIEPEPVKDENAKTYSEAETKEYLETLILEELKHERSLYKTANFAEQEIENDRNHFETLSKFRHRIKAVPKDRITDDSEILRENVGKIRLYDGNEIEAYANEYDEITNQSIVIEAVNYEEKDKHTISLSTSNFNNDQQKRSSTMKEDYADMEKFRSENGFRDIQSSLLSNLSNNIETGEKYGNIDSMDEFIKEFENESADSEIEQSDNYYIQFETSQEDAELFTKNSHTLDECSPILAVNEGAYKSTDDDQMTKGLNDTDGYTVVVPFSQFKKIITSDKMMRCDEATGEISYGIDITRARIFNDMSLFDEKKTNEEIRKSEKDFAVDHGTMHNGMVPAILALGTTMEQLNINLEEEKVLASVEKTADNNGRNLVSNFALSSSDKNNKVFSRFAEKLKHNLKEELMKVSVRTLDDALSFCKDTDAKVEESKKMQLDERNITDDGSLVLENNSRVMHCMIYDRINCVFMKTKNSQDEKEDYLTVTINRNEPFRLPDSQGSYAIIPFETIEYDEETQEEISRKEILELNPKIGLLNNKAVSEREYQMYVDNVYEISFNGTSENGSDSKGRDRISESLQLNREESNRDIAE